MLITKSNDAYDLGNTFSKWGNLYLSGSGYTKIISATCGINNSSGLLMFPNESDPANAFRFWINSSNVLIYIGASATSVASRSATILLTFEE